MFDIHPFGCPVCKNTQYGYGSLSEKHPIRNGIIATVIGDVILAALGQLWPPANRLLGSVWGVLAARLAVPVWVLVVVAVVVLAVVRLRWRAAAGPAEASTVADDQTEVSDLERQILGRLVKADGTPVSSETLTRSLRATNLRVQTAVDSLEGRGLVDVLEGIDDEEFELLLTARGRHFVVQQGLA